MISNEAILELESKSKELRLSILDTTYKCGKGHIGGAYSCIDIIVSLYYGGILKYMPSKPSWDERDRFILSKGHSGIALYAVLSDLEYFSKNDLDNFNNGGILGEHPDKNIPGVEMNTGSLGHGLGVGSGYALAAKLDEKEYRTFVLLGDGECNEGSIWEATMFAAHHKLNNLIAIIDRNKLCIHGDTEDINSLEPLEKKFDAFGWNVESVDGHSHENLISKFRNLHPEKPNLIIANTTKGKGVSFMEDKPEWHHGGIDEEKFNTARSELIKN